jgi:4-carboxymuconolactone decarboxylase
MGGKDFDKGLATRRKVLGDEWVDRAFATQTPFNADFQELITRFAWNEIWNRKGLGHRERRMIVIAQTAALARWEEFRLHAGAALRSGDLTQEDLKEILLQTAVYCGVPTANHAFREARDVIATLSQPPASARPKAAKKRQ